MNDNLEVKLRDNISKEIKAYYKEVYGDNSPWKKGDKINYAGRVFDQEEMVNLVNCSLDFWLTAGRYADEFEEKLSKFLDIKYCSLTNSGSSANLLAFMALTSSKLGYRRIEKDDEVITVAAGFPTTVGPIIQYGAIPVFIDVTLPTYNIDISKLEEALSLKTKAVVIAHTLGNPFDLKAVKEFCLKHNLWLIEDNCDALGSKYYIDGEWRYTGTIGDIGTSSFYPPHHITMGEGGAVYTDNFELKRIIDSFRDWGRDCWCKPGHDNTCKNRFDRQFGTLPCGYDHKYVYSHFGYNLKITDMQASIGCAQLKKLPTFIEKRRANWDLLKSNLSDLDKFFILPQKTENSLPSWFGFILTMRDSCKFNRKDLLEYLESKGIQTRLLFAGNITKQPCFDELRDDNDSYRIVGDLKNTNTITEKSFWIGVYPKITEEMITYISDEIRNFISSVTE